MNPEVTAPIAESTDDSCKVHETIQPKETENRPRDKKGHFLPTKDASGKKKQSTDEETVKIRIVKDKQPKQPKDFKGKLDDLKEHLASRFIKSVIARKPRHIVIDGVEYHSNEVLSETIAQWDKTEDLVKKQGECLGRADKIISTGMSLLSGLEKQLTTVTKSRNRWRCFGIGVTIGFVGCLIYRGIQCFMR